jgi:hypothetical protein
LKTDRLARHDYLHIYDVRVQLPPISEAGPSEQWQQQFNAIGTKETKVETLTIDAIKAGLHFIDLQLKRKAG